MFRLFFAFVCCINAQSALTLLGAGGPAASGSTITCCTSYGSGNSIGGTSVATGTNGTAFSCAAGNTEVAFVYDGGMAGGTFSVVDSASNSGWSAYGTKDTTGNTFQTQVFVNFNIASSVTSVTASFTSMPSFYGVSALCLSGVTTIDFTQVIANGGFGTTITGGNYTTTHASEIAFAFIGMSGQTTVTPDTGYTALGAGFQPSLDGIAGMYQIFSSTQSGVHASGVGGSGTNWKVVTIGLY